MAHRPSSSSLLVSTRARALFFEKNKNHFPNLLHFFTGFASHATRVFSAACSPQQQQRVSLLLIRPLRSGARQPSLSSWCAFDANFPFRPKAIAYLSEKQSPVMGETFAAFL
jgi:hypothetical protein